MSLKEIRVTLVTNIFAPYRVPTWEKLAEKVKSLDIILLSDTESNRIWNLNTQSKLYNIHIINSKGGYNAWIDSGLYWGGNIHALLSKLNPTHLIVAGYTALPFVEAIFWGRRRKIPVVQWYESHEASSRFNKWPFSVFRRYMLHKADAWAAASSLTKIYLEKMNIPSEKIFLTPNTVDVEAFKHDIESNLSLRDNEPARFLYVGRFLSLKRIDLLISAFSRINPNLGALRLVGYGPQERELREMALSRKNIEFCQATTSVSETAKHYEWADIVVLPSDREVWGLVINEALASGCYVLASSLAGVTPDLVENAPFDVGVSFDPNDGEEGLLEILVNKLNNIGLLRLNRRNIAEWGQSFYPDKTVGGLLKAIAYCENYNNVLKGRNKC